MKRKMKIITYIALAAFAFLSLLTCAPPAGQTPEWEPVDIPDPVGDSLPYSMEDIGDYYLFSGDILLDKDDPFQQTFIQDLLDHNAALSEPGATKKSRAITKNNVRLWPNGNIVYYFDLGSSFSSAEVAGVQGAMAELEGICGVKFYNNQFPGNDYTYQIVRGNNPEIGGSSTVGYVRHPRFTFVQNDRTVILHELMHGLGIQHEHQRSDRNAYIMIVWINIMDGYASQFTAFDNDRHLSSYDYLSIMHYHSYAFARDPSQPVIISRNPSVPLIPWNASLSGGDRQGLANLYGGPRPRYGCIAYYYDSSTPSVETRTLHYDLTESSSVNINTPETITTGQPGNYTTLYFTNWSIYGNATIVSPGLSSTRVTGFAGDVTVRPVYINPSGITRPIPREPLGTGVAQQPVFRWLGPAQATSYRLIVSRIQDVANDIKVIDASGIAGTSYQSKVLLETGTKYCWKVMGFIGTSQTAWSDVGYFTVADTEPAVFTLTVDRMVDNGNGKRITDTFKGLTETSSVPIYTPQYVEIKDPYGNTVANLEFHSWSITGTATIGNANASSTVVSGFKTNANVVANYSQATPPPTNPPPPPTYTLTVDRMVENGNGTRITDTYTKLTSSSSVSIYTPQYVEIKDPYGGIVAKLEFLSWSLSGTATIANANANSTVVSGFGSNASVYANYYQPTPPPTEPPPTDPPPTYTLTVDRMVENGNGTRTTDTYTKLTSSSSVSIYSPQTVEIKDPYGGIVATLTFLSWSLSGTATIANANANSTVVSGFGSNASVTANYAQVTPPPTEPPPTEPPPTYTLTVDRMVDNGNGTRITDTYTKLTSSSSVSIYSPQTVEIKDPYGGIVATLTFLSWSLSGTATIGNANVNSTVVSGFGSNASVTANYAQVTPPPPTEPPPTDPPPTEPPPTAPPPAQYTLAVTYTCFTGDGTQYDYTEYYYNLTSASVVDLNAPPVVYPGYPIPELYFAYWSLSGTASIDNPASPSTSIRGFGSDVSVRTEYQQ